MDASDTADDIDPAIRLAHVSEVVTAWQGMHENLMGQGKKRNAALDFLEERMLLLHSLVLQAGINPGDVDMLIEMAREESTLLSELQATLGELDWLMEDLTNEIARRAPTIDEKSRSMVNELVGLLRRT